MNNRIDNKIFQVDLNYTKIKNCNNYYNISNITISKEILVIKDKSFNYFNLIYFKSKCFGNNTINNNYIINNRYNNINL